MNADRPILEHVIAVAMRGDDKYKRWPLGEMIAADERIRELEAELETCRKYRDAYRQCDEIATADVRRLEAENAALRGGQGVTVDELTQIIRTVDGSHNLGAGELAERILSALPPAPVSVAEATIKAERDKLREALQGLLTAMRVARSPEARVSLKEHRKAMDAARAALSETEGE